MRRLIVVGIVAALAGCATSRTELQPVPAATQEELLLHLDGFRFEGRASVRGGAADFVAPSLTWRQQRMTSEVQLGGSVFGGRLQVRYSPSGLEVSTSRGDAVAGSDAERFIASELGFMPPFAALRYWVLGLAAPGTPFEQQSLDSTGRLSRMTQLGWQIEFTRWTPVALRSDNVLLPQRLVATDGQLKLTVIVDRWHLGAGR
jgi:outer membrane lipoprotein LolB